MTSRFPVWIATTVAVAFAPASSALACVGCRQVGEGVAKVEPQTIQAGIALSWSVLFMLAVVLGVLTFLGFYISRTIARLEADRP